MDDSLSKGTQATAHYPSSEVPGPCLEPLGFVRARPVKLTHAAVYLVDLPKFITLSAMMLYAYPKLISDSRSCLLYAYSKHCTPQQHHWIIAMDESLSKCNQATAHYPSSEVPGPCLEPLGFVRARPVKLTHAAVCLVDLPKS